MIFCWLYHDHTANIMIWLLATFPWPMTTPPLNQLQTSASYPDTPSPTRLCQHSNSIWSFLSQQPQHWLPLHPPPSAPTPWTPAKKQLTLTLTIPSTPPPHTAYANSSHGVWPSLLQLQQHCFPPPPTTPTPTPTLQQLQQQRHTSATKNVFSVMSLSLYSYFSPSRTNPLLFSCICIISWQCPWHVSECQWHGVSLVFGATTYQQGRCHMWRHQRHYLSMSARHFILSTLPRFFMYVVRYVMNTNHKPQTMALKLAIDLW